MQVDQLTLAVDALNDGNLADQVFSRYTTHENRTAYIGATHAPDARNMIGIYRTFPTRSGNFKGTSKSSVKFTEDISVASVDGGTIVAPAILDLSFSLPVGTPAAKVKELRQRLIAALDTDSFMDALNIQLMI